MSDYHRYRAVAKRVDEPDGVSRHVENAKRIGIGVVGIVPAGGAAVAALIGGDHVIAGGRQRRHHLAPAIGELREAMQEQDRRPARRFVTCLQNMHGHAVHVCDLARADAGGESCRCHMPDVVCAMARAPEQAAAAVPRKARRERWAVIWL